jgi:dTDP-4-dehydrorhamnose 3,5-epimerase
MSDGAHKDVPSVTASGELLRTLLAGVRVREVRNVVTRNGLTTEVYRNDWDDGQPAIAQAIFVTLRAGAVSAWHRHERQLDRIFVVAGSVKLVLFDDRPDSATRGGVNEFFLDRARPTLVTVPPGLWHGLQSLGVSDSAFLNFFDRLYDHADPDEWRLPVENTVIPYRF